jgi:hypothetical protein
MAVRSRDICFRVKKTQSLFCSVVIFVSLVVDAVALPVTYGILFIDIESLFILTIAESVSVSDS